MPHWWKRSTRPTSSSAWSTPASTWRRARRLNSARRSRTTWPRGRAPWPTPTCSKREGQRAMSTNYEIRAIDAVVNIWTPEVLAQRPRRENFYSGKMHVAEYIMQGLDHEQMLRRMDEAGIEKSFLVAAKVGPAMHKASYHVPYSAVAEAINKYPDRFLGLAGLDATEGMKGVRELEKAVREYGFIGAHY